MMIMGMTKITIEPFAGGTMRNAWTLAIQQNKDIKI